MQKAAQAYFQTQVATTSQGDLLLLLYEGAIKFLKQAKVKIGERDYAEKGILISRAMDVIAELDSSLNVQKGGDLAQNLHHLYFFCNTRLLKANMNLDTDIIDEVIRVLEGLQEAFQQIINEGAQATPQPGTQSAMPRRTVVPNTAPAGNGVNDSMFAGGMLRPRVGDVPLNAAPAAAPKPATESAPVNTGSSFRPLGANGVARAVQLSQANHPEQNKPLASQKRPAVPNTAPKTEEQPVRKKQPVAAAPQAKSEGAPQPQAAKPKPVRKNPPLQKQAKSDAEQENPTTLPKQPLNFNKARMLAGYKKMASQT